MDNYIFVTCIFDIVKVKKDYAKRPAISYNLLFEWLNNLNMDIILFTDQYLIGELNENITIIEKSIEELEKYKLMDKLNHELHNPSNIPELNKYYCSCICSKIDLINEATEYLLKTKSKNINKHLI